METHSGESQRTFSYDLTRVGANTDSGGHASSTEGSHTTQRAAPFFLSLLAEDRGGSGGGVAKILHISCVHSFLF